MRDDQSKHVCVKLKSTVRQKHKPVMRFVAAAAVAEESFPSPASANLFVSVCVYVLLLVLVHPAHQAVRPFRLPSVLGVV